MKLVYDVIIIGSGPAGYTAAIYVSRANLKVLMIGGETPGGQLTLTSEVENYPGFSNGIMGPELMEQMLDQAKRFGTDMLSEFVTKVELAGKTKSIFVKDKQYQAKAVIISTGAEAIWLGLPSEQRLMNKGVSACATCDGYFFAGKHVVVVGGGDSAMEEATFLTKFAERVTVVHRRDSLRASKIMQDRAMNNPKIDFIWDAEVVEVLGKDFVEGVVLRDTKTKQQKNFDCQGLFVAIGHRPGTELFTGQLKTDAQGYLETKDGVLTAIAGVFAAGDVADPKYRQAITAAGDGCRAAIEAEKYIEKLKNE